MFEGLCHRVGRGLIFLTKPIVLSYATSNFVVLTHKECRTTGGIIVYPLFESDPAPLSSVLCISTVGNKPRIFSVNLVI